MRQDQRVGVGAGYTGWSTDAEVKFTAADDWIASQDARAIEVLVNDEFLNVILRLSGYNLTPSSGLRYTRISDSATGYWHDEEILPTTGAAQSRR